MRSRLFVGEVTHARRLAESMTFRYPSTMVWVDLDELPALAAGSRCFGYNRRRLWAVHDRDFLTAEARPIRAKLADVLAERGEVLGDDRVMLLTAPRYLNYVFNPVSFYFVYGGDDQLRLAVAEVNNTFGEKHVYVLTDATPLSDEGAGGGVRYAREKDFYVSPFMDLAGRYDFRFRFPEDGLDLAIDLIKQDQPTLHARLAGKLQPLTSTTIAKTVVRFPLTGWLTMTRIVSQAIKLTAQRARIFARPTPASVDTVGRRPVAQRPQWAWWLTDSVLQRFRHGRLEVEWPDGSRAQYGDPAAAEPVTWQVRDWRALRQIVLGGDIGLGESYMNGDWTTNDLPGFIRLFLDNKDAVQAVEDGRGWGRLAHRVLGWVRRNHQRGSKRNIAAHYDLSNALFGLFLDPSMTYSSAYFEAPDQSLEAAQQAKYRRLCEKVALQDGDHLLEIGCGWGGFACAAARYADCRVTGITISQEQYAYARQRVEREGLSDRVEIVMRDYRELEGQFDKIVSIEMFEAVGYAFYPAFFQAVDRVLAPHGLFAMQTISFPDHDFDHYRKTYDWIRKYIFPGGLLPSMEAISRTMARHTGLVIRDVEDIAAHYAKTLGLWQDQFNAQWEQVKALGFDVRFQRMWNFYLSYCEAAFASRYLGDLQIVFARPNDGR
jgi:cyclopropane-fatty-acyl-phospholipid synthase